MLLLKCGQIHTEALDSLKQLHVNKNIKHPLPQQAVSP